MPRKTINEFKRFIARGNVMDLAVGIVIGGAFTGIVQSLVKDVVDPVLGIVTGSLDFSNRFIALDGKTYETLSIAHDLGAPVLAWGSFITTIINFIIVAWAVFFMIKTVNRLEAMVEGKESKPVKGKSPSSEKLLKEILAELKKQTNEETK